MRKKAILLTVVIFSILVLIISANVSANLRTTFEKNVGETAKQELIDSYGGKMLLPLHDQLILETIFERIVEVVAKDSEYQYSLTVLNSNITNAFALPGGYIFITKGLLELVGFDPNQTAAALAHEIAHVEQKHGLYSLLRQLGLGLIMELGFYYFDLHQTDAVRIAAGALIEVVQSGYSREAELEADRLAQEYCVQSNFSPTGIIHLLSNIQKQGDESTTGIIFRSHPHLTERINYSRAKVASFWGQPKRTSLYYDQKRPKNQDPLGRFTLQALSINDQQWVITGYDKQNSVEIDWFNGLNAREATWSPNGQILAVTHLSQQAEKQNWNIVFFNRLGLIIDQWEFNSGGEVKNLVFSPDGTKLAYNFHNHNSNILRIRKIEGTIDISLEPDFVALIIDWNKNGLVVHNQDHEVYIIAPPNVEPVVLSEPVPQIIERKPRLMPNNNLFQFSLKNDY